jgi:hypothetical protein
MACPDDFVADTAYDRLAEHPFSFTNTDSFPKEPELGKWPNARHKEEFSMWRFYPGTPTERFVTINSGVADAPPGTGTISVAPTSDAGVGEGCLAVYRVGRPYLVSDYEREALATAGWTFT